DKVNRSAHRLRRWYLLRVPDSPDRRVTAKTSTFVIVGDGVPIFSQLKSDVLTYVALVGRKVSRLPIVRLTAERLCGIWVIGMGVTLALGGVVDEEVTRQFVVDEGLMLQTAVAEH